MSRADSFYYPFPHDPILLLALPPPMNAKYSRARSESPVSDDSLDAVYRPGLKSRRRVYVNAAVLLTFFSLMALVSFSFWTASPTPSRATEPSHDSSNLDALQPDVLDPSNYVLGAPTEHFRGEFCGLQPHSFINAVQITFAPTCSTSRLGSLRVGVSYFVDESRWTTDGQHPT